MPEPADAERAAHVRAMFARVARRYDRANRAASLWQDGKWRRRVVDLVRLPRGGVVLDIGTGTGGLAREVLRRDDSALVVGGDFSEEMMRQGRARPGGQGIQWLCADAPDLPFGEGTFDGVISGFLLRNVADLDRALAEQHRVLKPGGTVVSLETAPPPADWQHGPVRFYLRLVIPLVGRLVGSDPAAYAYLRESTVRFLDPENLAGRMRRAGFEDVRFLRLMFGAIAVHWGRKAGLRNAGRQC